jgi:serine O-acetyltransferase
LKKEQLVNYIQSQLDSFFPDGYNTKPVINKHIAEALDRMQFSLKHVKLRGYLTFDYLHSDLYAQFVYYLSNTIWVNGQDKVTASKLFYLNKTLHGLNCTYDTKLPDIFLLIHSVGTILGKASYADYFVACHNVTVGSDKGIEPIIGKGVYMGPGSAIVGNCNVNMFTHMAINSVLLDQDTTEEVIVIGGGSTLQQKKLRRNLIKENYFNL